MANIPTLVGQPGTPATWVSGMTTAFSEPEDMDDIPPTQGSAFDEAGLLKMNQRCSF